MSRAHRPRLAAPEDGAALARIYAPYVSDTAVSFELDPPTPEEMAARVAATMPTWPWLVAEVEGEVVGFAYGGPHRSRPAYRWSVEVSVYIGPDAHRLGVGRSLYTVLLDLLTEQGYRRAFAGITLPNDASVGLHTALGFEPVGIYRGVGYKHGRWHDVSWWQRRLGPAADIDSPLRPPRPLDGIDA